MNSLFRITGTSKQAFHQRQKRLVALKQTSEELLPEIQKIRSIHKRMGSRVMYGQIRPAHLGRDRFEAFCFKNGFKVKTKRAYHRTTNSLGVTRFVDLTKGLKVTGVNQVWASDITYYRIGERFYYLTFIMDLYSRFVTGYSVSKTMMACDTTLPALRMAYRSRPFGENLIIHSDGGGQYYENRWKSLTRNAGIRNSMCDDVYGNAHAERLNGILKNDYIAEYNPQTFSDLVKNTGMAVLAYNYWRPHSSIGNMPPAEFEKIDISASGSNMDNSKELPTFKPLLQRQQC
jgi:putative transposase